MIQIFIYVMLWIMWGLGFWAGFYRGKLAAFKYCQKILESAEEVRKASSENFEMILNLSRRLLETQEDPEND